ncbi:hypothetical protein Pmani_034460 [Petrolisthes manimaculis]|uniref:F-box/LRR-repeat protein n=1 Tax=Petrolisthes manimaculis TaxID=1843537 RepID=A0AAE1NMF0_9EUCA|nr:hypothetical protein Pmani_034460 [Petrolisthes manimaculis]
MAKLSWEVVAARRSPRCLRDLSSQKVIATLTTAVDLASPKALVQQCQAIRTMLPIEVRTCVVEETVTLHPLADTQHTLAHLLLLQLLSGSLHLTLLPSINIYLSQEFMDPVLDEIGSIMRFPLTSLHINNNVKLDPGILAELIHRSPSLIDLHVAGEEVALEVLGYLKKNQLGLQSLHLDSCNVTDLDVVEGLVMGYSTALHHPWANLSSLGTSTATDKENAAGGEGGREGETSNSTAGTSWPPLCHLSIQSPRVTLCGAVVLLHLLRNLKSLNYSYWNSSLHNLFFYLHQKSSHAVPFHLTSLSLWKATDRALDSLALCPQLQHLMMEYTDPSLTSLSPLSLLPHLTSLALRLVPENLVKSAIAEVGSKLLSLDVEFEEYTRTLISWTTIQTINSQCTKLQHLELKHLNISADPDIINVTLLTRQKSKQHAFFPEVTQLRLIGVVIQAKYLERLLNHNSCLEMLVLDVNNDDALTDQAVSKLIKNNTFNNLSYVYLSGGLLSLESLVTLLALPSIERIALHLPSFPLLSRSGFHKLQCQLSCGNYQCILEDTDQDDQ